MRAFIFIGGQAPPSGRILPLIRSADLLVAADSGLDTALAWGLEPDIVVGDMDSLADPSVLAVFSPAQIVRAKADKDETDTELAIDEARGRGAREIHLVGGGGGRLDHILALAALMERKDPPGHWHSASEEVSVLLSGSVELDLHEGGLLSIFPLGPDPLRMRSRGLAWPLDGLEFPRGWFGISNRALGGPVSLEVVSGRALLVRPFP